MTTPNVMHLTFVSDNVPDNHYEPTVITDEVRARNAARVMQTVASVTAHQSVSIGKATITAAEVQGALIDGTNMTLEAIEKFGWAKNLQAFPQAPPMDLLKIRPDISGAILPQSGTVERCTINIPWTAISGAGFPTRQAQKVRIAFMLDEKLKQNFADCIVSSLPEGSHAPNLTILNPKQFVSFTFESVDDAFVFAETVNEFRAHHD